MSIDAVVDTASGDIDLHVMSRHLSHQFLNYTRLIPIIGSLSSALHTFIQSLFSLHQTKTLFCQSIVSINSSVFCSAFIEVLCIPKWKCENALSKSFLTKKIPRHDQPEHENVLTSLKVFFPIGKMMRKMSLYLTTSSSQLPKKNNPKLPLAAFLL